MNAKEAVDWVDPVKWRNTSAEKKLELLKEIRESPYYRPITACFERAQQERIIKDFPQAVITTLTLDVATSLAQKQATGLLTLTNKLIEQIIDASWEAIKQ